MATTPAPSPVSWKQRGLLCGYDIWWTGAATLVIIWLLVSNCPTQHSNVVSHNSEPRPGLRGGPAELGNALVSSGSPANGVSDKMLRIQTRTHRKRDKGVKVKNARESNTDCHFVVDEEGMVTTTLA
ncbi:unnamed protein product, partial [Sphacelaria rigidula]